MPVEIHDCHQTWYHDSEDVWFVSGLLTLDKKLHLRTGVGMSKVFLSCPLVFLTNFYSNRIHPRAIHQLPKGTRSLGTCG
jgi:hypothetical protein